MTECKTPTPQRLAIIGTGSSGLISLKHALEILPDWRIECFEESDTVTGAWGHPYDGFVSTSTKYTTQFACHPEFDASVHADRGASRSEFFRDGEYGEYLSRFAERFDLRRHISHGHKVTAIRRPQSGDGWEVTYQSSRSTEPQTKQFEAVIVCTGLVAEPKPLGDHAKVADLRRLCSNEGLGEITDKTVVVVGGGEMAADFANRLAQPRLGNRVFLSLRSGIRVSPRYHPIRGVPSDFLRNRLMLSIHEDLRNWIGRRFVAARIRYQEWFEWLFPASDTLADTVDEDTYAARKHWGVKLNRRAKLGLFDMFHNKSDDFLTALAEQRLHLIGPPTNSSLSTFEGFDDEGEQRIDPDVVVPAVGFRSRLGALFGDETDLTNFYHGCRHAEHNDLFMVGFARPAIGNIPSISEVQARYVIEALSGRLKRPRDIAKRHALDVEARRERYAGVDTRLIYPVEMFPYCDRLAAEMGASPRTRSIASWWSLITAPASTIDYACFADSQADPRPKAPTYMPASLILLLLALKPIDWAYRLLRRYR